MTTQASFTRRFYRLMDGRLSWRRFDAMVARAKRMQAPPSGKERGE